MDPSGSSRTKVTAIATFRRVVTQQVQPPILIETHQSFDYPDGFPWVVNHDQVANVHYPPWINQDELVRLKGWQHARPLDAKPPPTTQEPGSDLTDSGRVHIRVCTERIRTRDPE